MLKAEEEAMICGPLTLYVPRVRQARQAGRWLQRGGVGRGSRGNSSVRRRKAEISCGDLPLVTATTNTIPQILSYYLPA